jgi:hypothetical protein
MRISTCVVIVAVVCAAVSMTAQQSGGAGAEQYAGVWSGSWEGAGASGGFELTLEKPKEGPMTGSVSVTGEPTYKATLKTLSFDGAKMTAKYDFTPDAAAEVALTATFDGKNASGGWSLLEKASGNEVVSGTWKVTKK